REERAAGSTPKAGRGRAAGLHTPPSQYPWSASGTSLVASLIPLWAQDGGDAALIKRFDDPSLKQKLHDGIAENMRKRGGPHSLLITEGQWRGKRLDEVAAAMKTDPISAAIAAIRVHDSGVV